MGWGKKKYNYEIIENGIVAGQKQPLGAVWCKTRLLNSGGQFDQLCNLIGGAILAQVICACASKGVCVCVCVCVFVRVCVRACGRASM